MELPRIAEVRGRAVNQMSNQATATRVYFLIPRGSGFQNLGLCLGECLTKLPPWAPHPFDGMGFVSRASANGRVKPPIPFGKKGRCLAGSLWLMSLAAPTSTTVPAALYFPVPAQPLFSSALAETLTHSHFPLPALSQIPSRTQYGVNRRFKVPLPAHFQVKPRLP